MGLVVSLVGACARGGGAVDTALDRFARPAVVVADRWREAELRDALDKAGIPAADLEVRGMGFRDGADNVRNFQRAIADGRVIPVPLLWRSAMSEARVTPVRPVTRSWRTFGQGMMMMQCPKRA